MSDTHSKITLLMRRKFDRENQEYFVGRSHLPAMVQLDRVIFLCFPFVADKEHGEEEGAELIIELAHDDASFRTASRTVRKIAEKILNSEKKEIILQWLDSIIDGKGTKS